MLFLFVLDKITIVGGIGMKKTIMRNIGIFLALVAAFLYAFVYIVEKAYINKISSDKMLFLMFLGAAVGLFVIHSFTKSKTPSENKITKKEVPKVVMIVLCQLFSSILLIEAVKIMNASLVSILSVFEIVMTSLCAYFIFKDPIEKNEFIAIILVFFGGVILNFNVESLSSINVGSLLMIGACFFWGLENNITASLSKKEPAFFTSIKCGSVALLYLILMIIKGDLTIEYPILVIYGFFAYGLAILAYVYSTRYLGASKATLVFSFCPLFGALLSFLIFNEKVTYTFIISANLMIAGIMLMNYTIKKK